jgi:hypothetical protein
MRSRIGVDETGLTHGPPCSATPNSAAATDQRSTIMAANIPCSPSAQTAASISLTSVLAKYPASTYIVGVDASRDFHLAPRAQQSHTPFPSARVCLIQHGTAHNGGNETPLTAATKAERLDRFTQANSWCHHHEPYRDLALAEAAITALPDIV